jgi:hypothetical protein
MKKIPTTEEYLKERLYITHDGQEDVHDSLSRVSSACRDLIMLHVTAALKAASEKVTYYEDESKGFAIDPNSIINAYSLENIK